MGEAKTRRKEDGSTGLGCSHFCRYVCSVGMDKFGRQYITLGCGALTLIGVFGICMRSVNAIWEIINLRSILHRTFGIRVQGLRNPGLELTGKPLFSLPV